MLIKRENRVSPPEASTATIRDHQRRHSGAFAWALTGVQVERVAASTKGYQEYRRGQARIASEYETRNVDFSEPTPAFAFLMMPPEPARFALPARSPGRFPDKPTTLPNDAAPAGGTPINGGRAEQPAARVIAAIPPVAWRSAFGAYIRQDAVATARDDPACNGPGL